MNKTNIYINEKKTMSHVSKVNKKRTLLKENNNTNNNMSYMSKVIYNKGFRKKYYNLFTYRLKSPY